MVPTSAVKTASLLVCVIAGRAVGSKLKVTVMGAAKLTPGGPNAYAVPPEIPPPGTAVGVTACRVIVVGVGRAPAGISTDDPSLVVTVPPAAPIVIEVVYAEVDPAVDEWQPGPKQPVATASEITSRGLARAQPHTGLVGKEGTGDVWASDGRYDHHPSRGERVRDRWAAPGDPSSDIAT